MGIKRAIFVPSQRPIWENPVERMRMDMCEEILEWLSV